MPLPHHARLTEEQKQRLTLIVSLINQAMSGVDHFDAEEMGTGTSKAISGLIEEIRELMQSLSNEVLDADIIASMQKIEHYEISSYGTAVAFAKQLELHSIESLLNETLQEEYDADDLLTALANAAINKESSYEIPEISEDVTDNNNIKLGEDEQPQYSAISISERTINSPGGRAGTSHRGYSSGESRGH